MARSQSKRVVFISSFLPRRCGIATFSSDLINNIKLIAGVDFEPLVVAMQSDYEHQYSEPVKFEIRQNVKNDYLCAGDYINFSHVDVVSIQHEFGLFGGDGGSYLNLLLARLNAPVITTLHTVLAEPAPEYYKSLVDVCEMSHKVVVMNKRGIEMLHEVYGISTNKISLIPHGIPDLPFVDSNYYKSKFGMEGRRTILTFGLLGRNKGIEMMLKAMPSIVEADRSVMYIILGMTHPEVARQEGESYRFHLQRMVKDLGVQENVIFHNRFVSDEELRNFLCAAEIYVTPYLMKEQLTSGTLGIAVGAGKAVVSTPYWAALEFLAKGRGKLVRFEDSRHIAKSIIELLQSDALFYSMRRRAYDFGRTMIWPKVAAHYWRLFTAKRLPARMPAKAIAANQTPISIIELPEPRLDHLIRLTDTTGLYRQATFTIPNRNGGYCTTDNALALVAMTKFWAQYADKEALRLFGIYLSFISHAQNNDGTMKDFMSFERRWVPNEPAHDALGRVLWAFGTAMAKPPFPAYLSIIKDCFDKSVRHIASLSPRGMAYSILGLSDYLKQFPGASDIKRALATTADGLVMQYEMGRTVNWDWFEEMVTYDNAVLPHALFVAAVALGEEKYLSVANKTCEFILEKTFNGYHFSFVGTNGWYKRGGQKANFDQQPIEAGSTVMMLKTAYEATDDDMFLALWRKAFDWFLGENDLHVPVYDFKTKGCCDALEQNGVSMNQGGESMVSFLLGLLYIVESYSAVPSAGDVKADIVDEILTAEEPRGTLIEEVTGRKKAAPETTVDKLG